MKQRKKLVLLGSCFGGLGIILGAFGAHGLESIISEDAITTFETGVKYQIYHALFLLFLSAQTFTTEKLNNILFWLILAGVVFFSGSIYGLATNELTSFDFKAIAWITPIGGTLLILSWALVFIQIIKKSS
ncbi:DUF423 domain-containing protein [Psychroflexus gondwanensis]|jgi:uncharacterized membrane protein YgdD (TMEM256/DUF423 family)|uniref:DUF423 domain-containing protein n=1 Tax=Psychroflexus gondwanensis ACAM 44 TaxID=1189619 RepID=N1WV94_9FLAO|nr:DUF423 domain-containing protein [Psychroflexus gondwanensis]EMY81132.1 hypothetical protein pgond44_07835 [Psychroflexus gondwanensis ACAM 44]TXE20657.1 DUF423 domain-containing protein [Psychroflexus gondwanensis]